MNPQQFPVLWFSPNHSGSDAFNRFPYKLIYPLLAAVGLLAVLVAILPAQAQTTLVDFDETLAYTPASLTANAPLTQTQPGPRYGHTLTRVGDSIYLFGGMDALETETAIVSPMADVLNELWAFNSTTEKWIDTTTQSDRPDGRFGHAASTSNGKLFVQGGQGAFVEFWDQWYYHPISETWQTIVPDNQGPNALVGHAAISDAGGAPVLFGGASLGGTYMDTRVWHYNPVSNRYYVLKEDYNDALKRRWHFMGSFMGGGRFLMFGGVGADGLPLKDVWLFDLETRTWTQEWPRLGLLVLSVDGTPTWETAVVSPTARAEMAGVTYGERFLVLGGIDESGAELAEVWEYNLATHSWRALPSLPAPRRMAAAAILDEREDQVDVLVFGGISGGAVISDTLVYTVNVPPTYSIYLPVVKR